MPASLSPGADTRGSAPVWYSWRRTRREDH
jgi:hypothetical protein